MRKMGILYFGGFELPDKNAAAHRVVNNAKALRDAGYQVVLCGVSKESAAAFEELPPVKGFESYALRYPRGAKEWFRRLFDISFVEKILAKHPDINTIIAYNAYSFMLDRLVRASRKRNIKVLADCTEWYEDAFSLSPRAFIQFLNTNNLMKRVHRKVDGLILTSRYLADYYSKKKTLIVPPLIDIAEPLWHNNISQQADGLIRLVYTGIPGPDKDKLSYIIHTLAESGRSDVAFEVIGMTREDFLRQNPEGLSDIEALGERISFRGRLSHDETLERMRSADGTIIIRDRTRKNQAGFPTKFVEACTCGIQIIANDFSDIRQYASDSIRIIDMKELGGYIQNELGPKKSSAVNDTFDYRQWKERIAAFVADV